MNPSRLQHLFAMLPKALYGMHNYNSFAAGVEVGIAHNMGEVSKLKVRVLELTYVHPGLPDDKRRIRELESINAGLLKTLASLNTRM